MPPHHQARENSDENAQIIYDSQILTQYRLFMFRTEYSTHRSKPQDEDIKQLKELVAQLIKQIPKKQPSASSQHNNERILKLQRENQSLRQRIESLTSQNKKIIRELLAEREENTKLKDHISDNQSNRKPSFERTQSITVDKLEPSRTLQQSQLVLQRQSSPSRLVTFNTENTINRDQLYRLNSNLIEYNTNIKLLIEKYNYLHKLRGINFSNDAEQLKVINQANQIFSNKKLIEQAHSILKSSRKKYFGSDSSSDIQEQFNQIQERT